MKISPVTKALVAITTRGPATADEPHNRLLFVAILSTAAQQYAESHLKRLVNANSE